MSGGNQEHAALPGMGGRGDYDPKLEVALLRPIPNMDALRVLKKGYRDEPINLGHRLSNEPLVKIHDFGLAGQAYYSRPNGTTGGPVGGVSPELYLRESVAKTLAVINAALRDGPMAHFFGGEVELYMDDALRPVSLQRYLYETAIPDLIRKQTPDITADALEARRQRLIAAPTPDPLHPSPHATGGACDVFLRFRQDTPGYVPDVAVPPMGHGDGDTSERVFPDYYEVHPPRTGEERLFQRNRRAFYNIMAGKEIGIRTGLVNNPTEWWHWSRGDQLAARVSGGEACYTLAEPLASPA